MIAQEPIQVYIQPLQAILVLYLQEPVQELSTQFLVQFVVDAHVLLHVAIQLLQELYVDAQK